MKGNVCSLFFNEKCYHKVRSLVRKGILKLAPTGKIRKWSPDELKRLDKAIQMHGTNWSAIAKVVKSRNMTQVRNKLHVINVGV